MGDSIPALAGPSVRRRFRRWCSCQSCLGHGVSLRSVLQSHNCPRFGDGVPRKRPAPCGAWWTLISMRCGRAIQGVNPCRLASSYAVLAELRSGWLSTGDTFALLTA